MRRRIASFDPSLRPTGHSRSPETPSASPTHPPIGDRALSMLALLAALAACGLALARPPTDHVVEQPADRIVAPAGCSPGLFMTGWDGDASPTCAPPPAPVPATAVAGAGSNPADAATACRSLSDVADPGPCIAHLER